MRLEILLDGDGAGGSFLDGACTWWGGFGGGLGDGLGACGVDGAEVVGREGDVGGDLILVGGVGGVTAGGAAFSGEFAEVDLDEVGLAVELAGLVAEAIGGFHDIDPNWEG